MNRRGRLLIEMLIVGGVLLILFGGVALVLAQTGRNVWVHTQTQLAGLTQAQRALDRLSEDLRGASQASLACAGGTLSFTSSGSAMTYALDGSRHLVRTADGVPQIVGSGLAAFEPVCQGAVVELTIKVPTLHQDPKTFESRVWVRNP